MLNSGKYLNVKVSTYFTVIWVDFKVISVDFTVISVDFKVISVDFTTPGSGYGFWALKSAGSTRILRFYIDL